jgi:hydrogenase expression/formation protein HypD
MKYIDEYRDKALTEKLLISIHKHSLQPMRFMEVCGGHTMAIQKFGIPSLLPSNIKLLSGPGCPVCVTETLFIDKAIEYARKKNFIIATFGDLMRVPGKTSTFLHEKAKGADIRIIYSPLDALKLAIDNADKKVVFLAIGFETTAPGTALALKHASQQSVRNFFVLSTHKLMPPAMHALINGGVKIDGYIAPGHVSAITGSVIYDFIPEKYNIPVVISGFEPVDILHSIFMLVKQRNSSHSKVEIQYKRAVPISGNLKALELMNEIFTPIDGWWRGLSVLPLSKLAIKKKYAMFDAESVLPIDVMPSPEPKGCKCGNILKGMSEPLECKLFGKKCTPDNPVGPCMVSNEGACHAYYRYGKKE